MMRRHVLASASGLAMLLVSLSGEACGQRIARSQYGTVSQRIADAEITVAYSRPVARGREIYGGIVPFGEVWTPGADSATRIVVSRDVLVAGRPLAAGSYSIWTVPDPETWTVIFSGEAEGWHTRYPGEEEDVLRVEIEVERAPHQETLTFSFPVAEGRSGVLELRWAETAIRLPIDVEP